MAEETTPDTAGDESAQTKPVGQAPPGKTAGENAPPSTVEEQAPSVVSENLHSNSEPETTDIPTANAPDPTTVNPEQAPDPTGVDQPAQTKPPGKPAQKTAAPPKGDRQAAKAAAGDKPAAKAAKKEKAPTVEDKPFAEFIQQHYLPALKTALADHGVQNLELTFAKQKVPIAGYSQAGDLWQVMGRWQQKGLRQFNLYFPAEDIQGQRAFSCNEGSKPSTLEPFLIDERKVTLDLMLYGVLQRLDGQKWLERN